mgnify:CR=1 FL=1
MSGRKANMDREKYIKQLEKVTDNLNADGLAMVLKLMDGIDRIERYNIHTTDKRIREISQEILRKYEEKRAERAAEAQKAVQRAHTEWQKKRDRTISAMNAKERMFYDKIEGVKSMNIAEYAPSARQVELIATMYNNNYLNAQYEDETLNSASRKQACT